MNVSGSFWVGGGPDLDVLLNLEIVDPALVNPLHVVESLQSYCDEEIEHYLADDDDVNKYEGIRTPHLSASVSLVPIFYVKIIIKLLVQAVMIHRLFM